MNAHTQSLKLDGPAGPIEAALDLPPGVAEPRGLVLVCHPHPLHGGTMSNKVVQTLARAFVLCGWRALRFNFRGVGHSAGQWDAGPGEIDDAMAVLAAQRQPGEAVAVAGFSFGGYVASQVAARLGDEAQQIVLVGPATQNFPVAPVPPRSLVVHGEADDVVPLSSTLDWARPQSLPVLVIPGVGHFFHGQLPLLRECVVRHIRQHA